MSYSQEKENQVQEKKKERKTSPHPRTLTSGYTLVFGLSPPCLTVYTMRVGVFVSECLSVSLSHA